MKGRADKVILFGVKIAYVRENASCLISRGKRPCLPVFHSGATESSSPTPYLRRCFHSSWSVLQVTNAVKMFTYVSLRGAKRRSNLKRRLQARLPRNFAD